jgi:radical SAM protein with 4Fe4S-binding SPASM domain
MGSPDLKASLWKKALTTRRIFPARKRFPQSCKSPWQEVKILVDGRVAPCCFSDTGMGNIQKDSFEKIWNGIRYRFFRWRIRTIFPPRECRVCHSSEGINKGNPANVLLKEGLLLKVFYYLEHRIQKWFYTRRKKGEVKNYYKGKWLRPNPAVHSRGE